MDPRRIHRAPTPPYLGWKASCNAASTSTKYQLQTYRDIERRDSPTGQTLSRHARIQHEERLASQEEGSNAWTKDTCWLAED
jgi:hypothetical protein